MAFRLKSKFAVQSEPTFNANEIGGTPAYTSLAHKMEGLEAEGGSNASGAALLDKLRKKKLQQWGHTGKG